MEGFVSVVIPCRNGAKYLGEAIESVLGQGRPEIEVIVVDNGSTDASASVAESFGAPVRLLRAPILGAAHARNTGVAAARGEFLAFQDADDVWAPGKLERQLGELNARRDLDMVFTHGRNFLSPELTEQQCRAVSFRRGDVPFVAAAAMLARLESFRRAGPLPDLREGEFIAWYGIAQSVGLRSAVIPETLVYRRVHLSNSTRVASNPGDLLKAAKMVLDRRRGIQGREQ